MYVAIALICVVVLLIVEKIIWYFKELELLDRATPYSDKQMRLSTVKKVLKEMGYEKKPRGRPKKRPKEEKGEKPKPDEGW